MRSEVILAVNVQVVFCVVTQNSYRETTASNLFAEDGECLFLQNSDSYISQLRNPVLAPQVYEAQIPQTQ
jgi:hypothetical protein